jgi:Asp-tRNA(Asn)/Glu-tRNA(Gln) amidotransferase A subunit family amidase
VTGQPAITLPTGLVEGLPAGVQIATSLAREDILLNLSAQLEDATDWSARRPMVSVANL